jgi:hypothetical protein
MANAAVHREENRPHSPVIRFLRDCGRSRNKVTEFRKKSPINRTNAAIFYFFYCDFSVVLSLNIDYMLHCISY